MDRIEEIESAIENLPPEQFQRFAQWFRLRDEELWSDQMDRDCASGKLDFLFEEATIEEQRGLLRDWPPVK